MAAQLRYRTLLAGTAIAALALTGCVQSGEDEEETTQETSAPETSEAAEPTQESSSSEEPTSESSSESSSSSDESASSDSSASSDPSASSDSTGASGEAPEDLDDGDLTSALSSEINGVQLMAVTPDQLGAAGVDMEEELSSSFGEGFEISPAQCEDPFMGALLGGLNDTEDAVMAVDSEGSLLITARTYDDAQAAQEALQEQRDAVDDCSDVEVTVEGESSSADLATEDLTVEGASAAYEATLEIDGESVANPAMAYGNTVVRLVDTAQFEGGSAPDNQALLEEIGTALSEG